MNLLDELTQLQTPNEKAIARITGKKPAGAWIAQTLAGAVVVLTEAQPMASELIGKLVYYNRATGQILAVAPNVSFQRWAV